MASANELEPEINYYSLAQQWYAALMPIAYSPQGKDKVVNTLALLAQDATRLLLADEYAPSQGETVGVSLVNLNFVHGDALSRSLKLLSSAWLGMLPGIAGQTERLSTVLADIASGYSKTAMKAVLEQQESIREAQLVALKELHSNLLVQDEQLRKANQLLQANISERDRIAAELRTSEEQFRVLFQDAPIALWLMDGSKSYQHLNDLRESGLGDVIGYLREHPDKLLDCVQRLKVLARNQKAEAIANITNRSNILRTPPGDLGRHGPAFSLRLFEIMLTGHTQFLDTTEIITDDDQRFKTLYQWSVPSGVQEPYARMILGIVDITDQARAENELRLTAERLQTLHEIESSILVAQSAKAIAETAVVQIMRIVSCEDVTVSIVDDAGEALVVLAGSSKAFPPGRQIPFSSMSDLGLRRLQSGRSINFDDIGSMAEPAVGLEPLIAIGHDSMLSMPLVSMGQLLGTLLLSSKEKSAFSQQHQEILKEISASIAVALYNNRLLETEKRARRESETLRQVAAGLSSSLQREELLDFILVQLEQVLPYDGAVILLQEKGSTRVAAQRGYGNRVIEALHKLEQLPPNMQRLVERQEPLLIADTKLDPDWITLPGSEHVRSWLGVPLATQGKPTGILALSKSSPNYYKRTSADLAKAFANQVSVAIENAQLYQEVQQSAETLRERVAARTHELEALYAIAAVTSELRELEAVLETALEHLLGDLGCPSGAVHRLDDARERLLLVASCNLEKSQQELIHEVDTNCELCERIIIGRETIIVRGSRDSGLCEGIFPDNVCCYAGTPINVRGEVIGTLSLYDQETHELTEEQIRLLVSVADHMGVAIENANLRRQAEQLAVLKERERLARELHDSATQSLFSLVLFATAAREKVRANQTDRALQYLEDIRYTANQTHREMRLLLHELGTPVPDEEGLVKAIERRLRAVEGRSGVNTKFFVPHTIELDAITEQALYQIATEALNNALKHAGATEVAVELTISDGFAILSVMDNGEGFDPQSPGSGVGMGLANMRLRATRQQGDLAVESSPGQGTRIVARLPIAGNVRAAAKQG